MLRGAAIACTFLLLAGCLGGSSPPSNVTPAAATSPAGGAPGGGLTGANASSDNATLVALRSSTVQYAGKSETGACAFAAVVGQCQFPDAGAEGLHALETSGKPQRVSGTLTWTSTAPGTTFFYFACKKTGNNVECHGKPASGPSPLKFDFDLSPYNATDQILLATDNELGSCAPAPACAYTFPGADFKVDGTLTTVKPPG